MAEAETEFVELPAPTAWPMGLAASIAFASIGVMTDVTLLIGGVVLVVVCIGGWIRELTPGRGHVRETLRPVEERPPAVARSSRSISQPRSGFPEHRQRFPEQIHPYSRAAAGGLLAGLVMMVLAVAHSLVKGHGLFFNMNLLSAVVLQRFNEGGAETLAQFEMTSMIVAVVIHFTASVSVGLMFGLVLPMLPRSPLFWAALVAPLLWSGFLYGLMGVINPVMNQHIDWFWFFVCQVGFGLTLGWHIARGSKQRSWGTMHRSSTEGGQ